MGEIQLSSKPVLEFFEVPIERSGKPEETFAILYDFCRSMGKNKFVHIDFHHRYFYANNIVDKVSLYFSKYRSGIYLGTVAHTEEEARERASIFIENFNAWYMRKLKYEVSG